MSAEVYIQGMGSVSNIGPLSSDTIDCSFEPLSMSGGRVEAPDFPVEKYITKKRDINSMGLGQKLLVCAAGLALEDGGLLGTDISDCDIYMASKIGERNDEVDTAIIAGASRADLDINTELARLRPTHFLAELPNLYSANIAMMFGAKGESVTFVGEASASVLAVTHAIEKLSSGQATRSIVGGVFNGAQKIHDEYQASIKARAETREFTFGCAATCLVLSRDSEGAIAKLRRVEQFNFDDLAKQVRESEAMAVSVSLHPGADLPSGWTAEVLKVPVLDIAHYLGSVFEATLPTQVLLSLLYFKKTLEPQPGQRVLLIAQVGHARFEAFCLDVL